MTYAKLTNKMEGIQTLNTNEFAQEETKIASENANKAPNFISKFCQDWNTMFTMRISAYKRRQSADALQ